MAAVNNIGSSTLSSELRISTAADVCTVTQSTFLQPEISYILGSASVSFGMPTYTLNGCFEGEDFDSSSYYISCETAESITLPVDFTPPTGGNIKTFDSSKVGSYICTLTATS